MDERGDGGVGGSAFMNFYTCYKMNEYFAYFASTLTIH